CADDRPDRRAAASDKAEPAIEAVHARRDRGTSGAEARQGCVQSRRQEEMGRRAVANNGALCLNSFQPRTREEECMKLDRPEGKPDETIGWGSDIAAEMLRRFNIPYISLNPGASYRGLHDS